MSATTDLITKIRQVNALGVPFIYQGLGYVYMPGRGVLCIAQEAVKEARLLEGTTYIRDDSFKACQTSLQRVKLPRSLITIGPYAFANCTELKRLAVPEDVIEISGGAFCFSGLESIFLPKGIKSLNEDLFSFCHKLRQVSIPPTVLTIESRAFWYCTSLRYLIVPDKIFHCAPDAFDGAGLEVISLPSISLLQGLARKLVYEMPNLREIWVRSGQQVIPQFLGLAHGESIVLRQKLRWGTPPQSYRY